MIAHRTASLDDLQTVLGWAADEGWNPGLDDAAAFHAADPAGFFVATLDGGPVAAISVVNHTDAFSFLGLYLVRPAYRGQGIGYDLWQHALEHAGARTVGLDGVPDQQANYATSGFVAAGTTTRYAGHIPPLPDPTIRTATPDDIPTLTALEAAASGVRKDAYLHGWFNRTPTRVTLVAGTAGACTVRQCRSGAKIGPLIAQDHDTAQRLIGHAASLFDGDMIIDVPEPSQGLATLCQRAGLVPGFNTARMYRGPFTPVAHPFFAVTSLELG